MTKTDLLSASSQVRATLDYPVIDADGHAPLESMTDVIDTLRDLSGPRLANQLQAIVEHGSPTPYMSSDFLGALNPRWGLISVEERRARREPKPPWGRTRRPERDWRTLKDPQLFYERLDEFGIDFAVIFPNVALAFTHIDDEELRRGACRALNTYNAVRLAPYGDRMASVAAIPMHTPEEAIEELNYAVTVLGLKAVLIAGYVTRPIESVGNRYPELERDLRWIDLYGLDSEHDYDPFWAKCVELGVSPMQHSAAVDRSWGAHRSISNYQFNQVNCFTDVNHALCKALFMGGVTRRFPTLRFGFLESGVAWACQLYADMCGRWPKRHPSVLERGDRDTGSMDVTDEWAACGLSRVEDIQSLFVENFYFGCEADDPMNAIAFGDFTPFGAKLKAFMGSDLGHWDVFDLTAVIAEAYELVEHGRLDDDQLKDFLFANPARFFGEYNPNFFAGTVVEADVRQLLASPQNHHPAPATIEARPAQPTPTRSG